jgi:hypothetical protein
LNSGLGVGLRLISEGSNESSCINRV